MKQGGVKNWSKDKCMYLGFWLKPGGKRRFGRPRRRRENNIKVEQEVGCGRYSTGSEYEPVTSSCEHNYAFRFS